MLAGVLSFSHMMSVDSIKEENTGALKYGYGRIKGYKIIGLGGSPFFVRLTNVSDSTITIQPEVTENSLVPYDEVIEISKKQSDVLIGLMILSECFLGGLLSLTSRGNLKTLPIVVSMITSYMTYEFFSKISKNTENAWKEKMLREHEQITIKPGETMEKIFWVKNTGSVTINYPIVQPTKVS